MNLNKVGRNINSEQIKILNEQLNEALLYFPKKDYQLDNNSEVKNNHYFLNQSTREINVGVDLDSEEKQKKEIIDKISMFLKNSSISKGVYKFSFIKNLSQNFDYDNKFNINVTLKNNQIINMNIHYAIDKILCKCEIDGIKFGVTAGSDNIIIYDKNQIRYLKRFESNLGSIYIDKEGSSFNIVSDFNDSLSNSFVKIEDKKFMISKQKLPVDKFEEINSENKIYRINQDYYKLIECNNKEYFMRVIYFHDKNKSCPYSYYYFNDKKYPEYFILVIDMMKEIISNKSTSIDKLKQYFIYILKDMIARSNGKKIHELLNKFGSSTDIHSYYILYILYLTVDCKIKDGIIKNIYVRNITIYKNILKEVFNKIIELEDINQDYIKKIIDIINLQVSVISDKDVEDIKVITADFLKQNFEGDGLEEFKQELEKKISKKIKNSLLKNNKKIKNLPRRLGNKISLIKNSKNFIKEIIKKFGLQNVNTLKNIINHKIILDDSILNNIINCTDSTKLETEHKKIHDLYLLCVNIGIEEKFKEGLNSIIELTRYKSNSNKKNFSLLNWFNSFFRNLFNIKTNSSKELLKFIDRKVSTLTKQYKS
jgi:hypothetical protein